MAARSRSEAADRSNSGQWRIGRLCEMLISADVSAFRVVNAHSHGRSGSRSLSKKLRTRQAADRLSKPHFRGRAVLSAQEN